MVHGNCEVDGEEPTKNGWCLFNDILDSSLIDELMIKMPWLLASSNHDKSRISRNMTTGMNRGSEPLHYEPWILAFIDYLSL